MALFAVNNGGTFPTIKLHRIIDGRDMSVHGTSDMYVRSLIRVTFPFTEVVKQRFYRMADWVAAETKIRASTTRQP